VSGSVRCDRVELSTPAARRVDTRFHRADIQGLRGISILLVLVYHLFPRQLPGGFVGVDIFFVVPGFLIGRILLRELACGAREIPRFFLRRILRLFPALILVCAAWWKSCCTARKKSFMRTQDASVPRSTCRERSRSGRSGPSAAKSKMPKGAANAAPLAAGKAKASMRALLSIRSACSNGQAGFVQFDSADLRRSPQVLTLFALSYLWMVRKQLIESIGSCLRSTRKEAGEARNWLTSVGARPAWAKSSAVHATGAWK